ncbi:MAG: hypothetical protein WC476_01600 [Phycisphaerae bacterium]|jgi:hypothetical protein
MKMKKSNIPAALDRAIERANQLIKKAEASSSTTSPWVTAEIYGLRGFLEGLREMLDLLPPLYHVRDDEK